jgi:hypothetical protein
VQDSTDAKHVIAEGRWTLVYTLEEVAKLLRANTGVVCVKEMFPGAEIVSARRSVEDPLNAIWDTKEGLDDPIPDLAANG